MTRLKGMADNENVFTITVDNGQLTLSVPVAAIEKHDGSFDDWVAENASSIGDVVRVATDHERIVADEQADAIASIQK
jgi:hypothetical protein